MINFRVGTSTPCATSSNAPATVDDKVQAEDNGRFGWAMDPEGNRFELWEPAEGY
jgi:hypothetical protein